MKLSYREFGAGFPVIILHGLLGSMDNWQTIAKHMAGEFKVYIVDQRNHGKSPHSDEFNYSLLADDLVEFMREHAIAKAHVVGHSMGGKTAMQLALQHPELVEKLVVVDIAPTAYEDAHTKIFDALLAIDLAHASSREEVHQELMDALNDETTVFFLMKSLQRNLNGGFEWRFNVASLKKNYALISGDITADHPFKGETLFMKGQKSNYINSSNYQTIDALFPRNTIEEVKGAGHWVHADKPAEVEQLLKTFFTKTTA